MAGLTLSKTRPAVRRRTGRLSAFTLLESMVATVLVTASFLTGMLIFGRVLTGDNIVLRMQANNLLLEALEETRSNPGHLGETWQAGDLVLQRKVHPVPETDLLAWVILTASAGGREIARIDALLRPYKLTQQNMNMVQE